MRRFCFAIVFGVSVGMSAQTNRTVFPPGFESQNGDSAGAISTAISILASSGSSQYFDQVVARKNVISAELGVVGSTSNLKGIKVFNVVNPIVEENVINDCENGSAGPLDYQNCTTFKAFNNQNNAGKLLRAYDSVNSKYLMELQDFTEDALLSF